MPGVFIAQAAQPSLKLKQLPPFYAFSAAFRIKLMSVTRTLHFWVGSSLAIGIFTAAKAGIPAAAGLVCPAVDNRARFRP
jgi:hypothetical protein